MSPPADSDGVGDVVAESVASYSEDIDAFVTHGADAVSGPFARFAQRLPAGAVVLDAGCGPGRDLGRLAGLGHHGIGLDLNRDLVALAAASGPVVVGDLRALALGSGSVDAVWASASLIHLPPGDAVLAVHELARVAKPGAPLGMSVKTAGTTGWADDPPRGRRWFSIWTVAAFVAVLKRAGLVVEAVADDGQWAEVLARRGPAQ